MILKKKFSEVLVSLLENIGVEYVFGIPGAPIKPILEDISKSKKIKFVLAKSELGAGYMAEVYSRVSGKIGVCLVSSGPGATGLGTALAMAKSNSTPLLIISGEVNTKYFGKDVFQSSDPKSINVVGMYKMVINQSLICTNPKNAVKRLIQTVNTINDKKQPIFLSLPVNIITSDVSVLQTKNLPSCKLSENNYLLDESKKNICAAVDKISKAKTILVIGGHGVLASRAVDEFGELVNKLFVPVVTTSKAKSCFANKNKLFFGTIGHAGSCLANNLLNKEKFDIVLVVGSRLGSWSTNLWCDNLRDSFIIQIDNDFASFGKNLKVGISVLGDIKVILKEMNNRIKLRATDTALKKNLELKSKYYDKCEILNKKYDKSGLDPGMVIDKVRFLFDDKTIFIVDAGTPRAWAINRMEFNTPYTFIEGGGFSPMGYATAGVIGASFALNKPVVAIVGDGSFLMHGTEVHTAVEYKLPIIWIIINNYGLAAIHHGQVQTGFTSSANFYSTKPRFDTMARSLGAAGYRITNLNNLNSELVNTILKNQVPSVIDIISNRDIMPPVRF
ncbi:thiamine pyrophosphate-binding protein [Patescibacteria group bacterium]|nr:thiamine pyrophosphate-binding protein [Patescibacteria group bacterium]MCG2702386.1 thiamine pyrophosphate-binding protein [Candidatus Parcubacteria bacterium]MBU4264843.1 thiamine pyrophosphate-binding protein [Patescibacteria group bacterium]MBU4389714.1 thiamine pyrophosphate-binding protein [Patescibacteria group bacterium]MBU4397409.1 thiamine pyrophosphate-binding protein [Patescibacteria group bacterium]